MKYIVMIDLYVLAVFYMVPFFCFGLVVVLLMIHTVVLSFFSF